MFMYDWWRVDIDVCLGIYLEGKVTERSKFRINIHMLHASLKRTPLPYVGA